jgi:archaemetzincin
MDENINILILNDISRNILRFLARNLSEIFDTKVKISRHLIIPTSLFNEEKKQYNGRKLLKFLTENLTLGEVRGINLAVFDRDLFTGSLDYAFGVASQFPKVCIISILRLHPHFDEEYFAGGMKKRKSGRFPLFVRRLSGKEKKLYYQRMLKEAVHGVGHTLGLTHCQDSSCIMYSSGDISDIDGKQTGFCNTCRVSLQ